MHSRADRANRERGKDSDGEFRIFASGNPEGGAATTATIASVPTSECVDRAMAAQKCIRAAQTRDPVDVGNQAGNEQHRRRHARDFIQSGAAESDRSQRMGDGFHEN